MGGHRNPRPIARSLFHRRRDRRSGSICGGGSSNALAASHPKIGVHGTEGDGVGMVAGVMLGERTGKGQFLRDKYDCVSLTHWERVVI